MKVVKYEHPFGVVAERVLASIAAIDKGEDSLVVDALRDKDILMLGFLQNIFQFSAEKLLEVGFTAENKNHYDMLFLTFMMEVVEKNDTRTAQLCLLSQAHRSVFLRMAAESNRYKIASFCIARGADVNSADLIPQFGDMPILLKSMLQANDQLNDHNGYQATMDMICLLLSRGADIFRKVVFFAPPQMGFFQPVRKELTVIDAAAFLEVNEAIIFEVKRMVCDSTAPPACSPALAMLYVEFGHEETVKQWHDDNRLPDLNAEHVGLTLLNCAIRCNRESFVSYLLNKNVRISEQDVITANKMHNPTVINLLKAKLESLQQWDLADKLNSYERKTNHQAVMMYN